ncbi:sporulation YhaL family protein [Virgibacillus siamensis]|uniref:sporulation YhaL family protein n=1 Tax=Virgibacillus siamensis TaxID=480071 RepID=UPI0009848258
MILGVPWWVFLMIIFIFISGYMAFRAMRAERELEYQFIEKEGKVYMDRLEELREEKSSKERNQHGSE